MPYIDAYTGMDVETPDEIRERQRKEAEEAAKKAGTTPVATTETTVYEDGSKTHTTTQEVPAGAQVNPRALSVAQSMAPKPMAQQPQAKPVAPTFNQEAYNASIAQQESGNRPNIGYHDRSKSTAFGPTGLTAAAYQDARRANPNLPADITQANPQQLNAAQTAYTQQNARALQGYGIDPSANNLAAAHFAGARGLNDYMTKKDEQGRPYISPQAQAANGGYDKAAAIINQRLGGQAAPASGAVQQAPSTFQGQTNEFGGMEEQPINQQALDKC